MDRKHTAKRFDILRQRYFAARELQFSIALLVIIALLSGIFLQTISTELVHNYGLNAVVIGVLLILGYALLVVLLPVFFTHRLIGPFKRLEYEMKLIAAGELGRRLDIRTKDDLHVKSFIKHTNKFISGFSEMSKEYSKLNSAVITGLEKLATELSKEEYDRGMISQEIDALLKQVRAFRERW